VTQAVENVSLSPFSERIRICHLDILNFADTIGFDAIVSNPP
jgi:tRNA1(Val) A37 N6-methylase TrmN6